MSAIINTPHDAHHHYYYDPAHDPTEDSQYDNGSGFSPTAISHHLSGLLATMQSADSVESSPFLPPAPSDIYDSPYPPAPITQIHSPFMGDLPSAMTPELNFEATPNLPFLTPEMVMGITPALGASPQLDFHRVDSAGSLASISEYPSVPLPFGFPVGLAPPHPLHFVDQSVGHANPKRPISRSHSHSQLNQAWSESTGLLHCDFPGCGMTFTRPHNFRAHASVHAKDRMHPCGKCGARFRRLPDLQRHQRSLHMEQKPFACPHGCGSSFSRKDALKRHLECKSTGVVCAGFRRR